MAKSPAYYFPNHLSIEEYLRKMQERIDWKAERIKELQTQIDAITTELDQLERSLIKKTRNRQPKPKDT
jgi:hypothetical protein